MNRCEKASDYHKKGYNCAQSVLASFSDLTGLPEGAAVNLTGGFGGGAGTGELCGAVSGAIMTLGLLHPIDPADPVGGKKRTVGLAKEFQKRFTTTFEHLRCQDLLPRKFQPNDATPAAKAMGLTGHCDIMIVTAVELVEQMLREER